MSLQVYYDRTYLKDPIPRSDAFEHFGYLTDDLSTYDVSFQDRFHVLEWNNIVWGLGYRFTQDLVENAPSLAFIPEHFDENLYNVFLQDEIKLHEKLLFTLGTKVEHNVYTGFEFEPSGRLQYNLTPDQMFWGAISRAVTDTLARG